LQALPRSIGASFESPLTVGTSTGEIVWARSTPPDCRAFRVAVESAIGLNVIWSRYGPPAAAFQ